MKKIDVTLRGFLELTESLERVQREKHKIYRDFLNILGSDAVRLIQDNVRKPKYKALPLADTGYLLRNTFYQLERDSKGGTAKVYANTNYAAALNFGTAPHWVPFRYLHVWVRNKLGIRDKRSYAVAKAIQRHIAEKGTRPYPYFDDAMRVLGKRFKEYIGILKNKFRSVFKR